jgi:hypothetical protein
MAMELGLRHSDPMSSDRAQRHNLRLWLALFHAENRRVCERNDSRVSIQLTCCTTHTRFNGCNRSNRPTMMVPDDVTLNAYAC